MSSGYVAARTLDIIAYHGVSIDFIALSLIHGILPPEEPPVTNTFVGLILYCVIAYLIIFAIAFESPPPSCVSDALLETSQHSVVELGHTVT
jgi:hypothetical protein